jgi:Integrase zinc binding domain/Chromo (CHRromatin Organisation MOdifier) domain
MDHQNLTYFQKAQKLSDRQARWSLFLSEFDIKLQHLPGNKMILSDALSRKLDHFPEEDKTKEEILLLDNLFLNLLDVNLRDRITKNKEYDFDVTKAIELLQEEGPTSIQNGLEDWKIEEVDDQKTIFYKGKQYVLKDQELRQDILKLFHDHEMAGHPGELETYNLVKQHHWWPGLRIFVKNYIKGCGICQQFKIDQNPSHPSFVLVEEAISTWTFAHCSMDLITDWPLVEGSDSILVVVDQGLLKGVILCPTTKTVTMDRIGDLLHENWYKWFGLPDKMLSDHGPQFAAKAFMAMLSRLGVNLVLSTAYHPQMDGTTEHINQEIEAYLAIYCHSHPETWKKNLATMEFTHNNRRHADWPKTSFEIIQGESPKALPLTYENTKFPSIDDKIKQIMTDRDEALAAHELARARIAERRWNTFTPFTVGQKVWLDTRNIKMNYHKKMAPKREGPFKVKEVLGPVTYRLKLPTTWKVDNVFHAVLLKPYIETEVHGENFSRPIPDILNGEEVYNVETILKHRKRGWSYQYLIKWEGYPISEASWEPETAFSDDGNLLSTYKQRHQLWNT